MRNQNIIIGMVLCIGLMIAVVSAQVLTTTTSSVLTEKEKQDLISIGIKKVSIVEYPCSDKQRCFKLTGDINEELINIPNKVSSGYKTIRKKENRTIIFNGRAVIKEVFINERTTEKEYRDITDDEVYKILDNSAKTKLKKYIPDTKTIINQTIKFNTRVVLNEK